MKKNGFRALLIALAGVYLLSGGAGVWASEEGSKAVFEEEIKKAADAVKGERFAADGEISMDVSGINLENTRIGISIYQFTDSFMGLYWKELVRCLTEEIGFKEENITVLDGRNDQAEQMEHIKGFIEEKVDLMILNLVEASAVPEVTDLCQEAGIPVVYINRQPDEREFDRWAEEGMMAAYVGADARQSGTLQGEEILDTRNKGDINGDGRISYIMIQGDPENIAAQYRTEYSVKAFTDLGMEVEELFVQGADWDQEKGRLIMEKALVEFGRNIEVVFCNNDAMALGALQAIQEAGRKVNEDIYLVGIDALPEAVERIIEGSYTGTVFNDYFSQARMTAAVGIKFLKNQEAAPVNMVDYIKVTSENAAEILELVQ